MLAILINQEFLKSSQFWHILYPNDAQLNQLESSQNDCVYKIISWMLILQITLALKVTFRVPLP